MWNIKIPVIIVQQSPTDNKISSNDDFDENSGAGSN